MMFFVDDFTDIGMFGKGYMRVWSKKISTDTGTDSP